MKEYFLCQSCIYWPHFSVMKLYFLMDRDREREERHQTRLELELEVTELQNTLEKEEKLNQILQCSLQGRLVCHSCLSSLVPLQVQILLTELAMVEEEIIYLERKVEDLKLCLYKERKENKEQWSLFWGQTKQKHHFLCGLGGRKDHMKRDQQIPLVPSLDWGERKASFDLVSEKSASCSNFMEDEVERPRSRSKSSCKMNFVPKELNIDSPNKLSEEIIVLLINIFHKLNKKTEQLDYDSNSSPKISISCVSSRNIEFKVKPCSNSNIDGIARDKGCTKRFINFVRDSFDISRIALCIPDIRKLRELIQRLSFVDLSLMNYKQKLAFWINIYNSCIMHGFLHHGLPQSHDKIIGLLKKAAFNVGGVILNALAIEHFILRHSSYDTNHNVIKGMMKGKNDFLPVTYGLEYPEPNVTFALCRGSRSSPFLRVYTAEDVSNELEIAKLDYLESSIRIDGKKKIIIPKLLYWHMRDFADDTESLLEWIYSQLPRHGLLKKVMKELLCGDSKLLLLKAVEIEPYEAEFWYLLPI